MASEASDATDATLVLASPAMPSLWSALGRLDPRGNWHESNGQKNQDSVRVAERSFRLGAAGRFRRTRRRAQLSQRTRLARSRWNAARGSSSGSCSSWGRMFRFSCLRHQMKQAWTHQVVAEWRLAVRADVLARIRSRHSTSRPFPEPMPATPPNAEWPYSAYLAYGATLLVAGAHA